MATQVHISHLRRAAQQGDAEAQYELACCYANGREIPQDDAEAAKWYQKAAEQGHADAQNNLGWMYETGRGVPVDVSAAIDWYRKAAAQGKEPAKKNLARLAPQKKPRPSPRQFALPLEGKVVGSCPICGSDVVERDTGYSCQATECRFKLKRVILSQVIDSAQASKLLEDGRTDLLSGFVSAKSGRSFSARLVLDEDAKITFEFPKQEPQEETPSEQPAPASKPQAPNKNTLLTHSLGIALPDNTYIRLFSRGAELPVKMTTVYHVPRAIRRGGTDVLKFQIVEGESSAADQNRLVGRVEIRGDILRKTIPAGAEVEMSFTIDASRILTAQTYVPELDEEFQMRVQMGRETGEPQQETPHRRTTRTTGECKPLIAAATKDLFRINAFRVTGLPVDASVREITKHQDRLTQMTKLGIADGANTSAFALKPPPTLAQLHEAHQRLKDPEQRFLDEFFWFWPEHFGQSRTDAAVQALQAGDGDAAFAIWTGKENDPDSTPAAMHNVALVWHLTALEWEGYTNNGTPSPDRRDKLENYWQSAFKRWDYLIQNDGFWDQVTARIRQINEPDRLPTGFARRMRANLPHALCKINAELAVAYVESGKPELAHLHVRLMRHANNDPEIAEKTAELVLTPSKKRLNEQLRRAKACTDTNPKDAPTAGRQLLDQATQTMAAFDLLLGTEHVSRNELADELAGACNRLVIAYHKATHDNATSRDLLREALPLARSSELTQLLTNNVRWFTLSVIAESQDHPRVRLNRLVAEAIPTPTNPPARPNSNSDSSLFDHAASILRAISLDAWNQYQDVATAVAAIDLAIKYACQPDLKQRLLADRATLKSNIDQAPPESAYTTFKRTIEEATPESAHKKLKAIESSNASPKSKLQRVRMELIPELEVLRNRHTVSSPLVRGLSDSIAALLRTISIDAYPNHQDLATALDAIDSARALSLDPVLKSRIEQRLAVVREALAKAQPPQESATKSSRNVPGIIALIVVAALILLGVISSCDTTSKTPSRNTYTPPTPNTPAATPPWADTPAPTYTPPKTSDDGNSGGNVYRVPSWASSTLKTEKEAIESDRATLEALETQIETLGREIESDRTYLDRTSQYAVDEFNAKVARYNAMAQRSKAANAAFNKKVNDYNAKLQQYSR